MKKTVYSTQHDNGSPTAFWQRHWFMGTCAGVVWFLIFAGGILIDAAPHRKALGWKTEDVNHEALIGRLTLQLIKSTLGPAGTVPQILPETIPAPTEDAVRTFRILSNTVREEEQKAAAESAGGNGGLMYHFLCGAVLFTPINVALLALAAGFIGGCASNETDVTHLKRELHEADQQGRALEGRHLRRRLAYLHEHPAYSMMRSFIVYLVFISGLYVVATDPFSPATQAQGFTQYVRLAGLVSLLSFMVGYDPTRFTQWVEMVPNPVFAGSPAGENEGAILATAHMQTAHANVQMQLKDTPVAQKPGLAGASE